ncbi:MAG: helix-turn-helix domain-containing protein, partial [archaeon]
MVTKLDVFLVIGLNSKINIKDIQTKLSISNYQSIHNLIKQLIKEDLVYVENKLYFLNYNNNKSKELFSLVYFCFKNNLDYNFI